MSNKLNEQNMLDNLPDLPTLPTVAMDLMQSTANEAISAKEMGQRISRDLATTTRLLRLVNSAYYSLSRRISTVSEAVVLLGFSQVKRVIIASSASTIFFSGNSGGLDRNRLWVHTLATATACDVISRAIGYPNPEEAYVAGLLHDIGLIILDTCYPQALAESLTLAKAQQSAYDGAIHSVLGVEQASIGGYAADRWRLPAVLGRSIASHTAPLPGEAHSPLAAIIHFANWLATHNNFSLEGYEVEAPLSQDVIDILKLDDIKIARLTEEFIENASKVEDFSRLLSSSTQVAA